MPHFVVVDVVVVFIPVFSIQTTRCSESIITYSAFGNKALINLAAFSDINTLSKFTDDHDDSGLCIPA